MISSHNIAAYIQFLYRQKYDSVAPNDLIQSWQNVPAEHIPSELQRLYAHWGMTESESENLTKRFYLEHASAPPHQSQAFAPPPPPPPSQNQYSAAPPYHPPPIDSNRSNLKPILIGVLLLVALGALGYYFLQQDGPSPKNDASIMTNAAAGRDTEDKSHSEELKAQLREVDSLRSEVKRVKDSLAASISTTQNSATANADTRERDISNILEFLYAEESKNITQVIKYFAPNVIRYWDLNNPSFDQLSKRYLHLWSKIENPKHVDIEIQNIGERTYDLTGVYTYYSIKDGAYKRVPVHTRYVMNESGKIIKTFGVKN